MRYSAPCAQTYDQLPLRISKKKSPLLQRWLPPSRVRGEPESKSSAAVRRRLRCKTLVSESQGREKRDPSQQQQWPLEFPAGRNARSMSRVEASSLRAPFLRQRPHKEIPWQIAMSIAYRVRRRLARHEPRRRRHLRKARPVVIEFANITKAGETANTRVANSRGDAVFVVEIHLLESEANSWAKKFVKAGWGPTIFPAVGGRGGATAAVKSELEQPPWKKTFKVKFGGRFRWKLGG